MQSNRQPKWDWDTHFDWMLDHYHRGATIPQIHKATVALECDTFRPCLRTVYDKFKEKGYDTSPNRVLKSSQRISPTHAEASSTSTSQQHFLTTALEEVVPRAPRCVPRVFPQMKAFGVLGAQPLLPYTPGFVDDGLFITQPSSHAQGGMEGENSIAPQTNPESWNRPLTSDSLAPEEFKIPGLRDSKNLKVPNMPEQGWIVQNSRDAGLTSKKPNPQQGGRAQHGGGRTRHPDQDKDSTLIRKIRSLASLPETKNSVSKSRANQASPFTNRDSGFYSGRRTPSSRGAPSILHFRDSGMSQVESFAEMKVPMPSSRRASSTLNFRDSGISQAVSFTEFIGPYRVLCQTQHEPTKLFSQYRRVKPCMFCRYSNIHNLAWVASNLTLQEFEDELSFEVFYDFRALDAAGNTALHYAAASGASPGHLKALIVAGVPPYQQNTAKQNFLHCLRHNTGIGGWDLDCFNVNLIQLLDFLEPKVIFGQQDNDGQTVLRVLTSHVTELEVRDQIIKKFTGSGFCLDIIDRFGRPAVAEHEHKRNEEPILEEIDENECAILDDPMWYTKAIDYPGDVGDDTIGTSSFGLEVSGALKWNNPFDAIVEALENPHSVDMITKDTVLHALSTVNVQTKGSMRSSDIINYLRDFVSKGVNLNWHNADGQTPLTAFICNKWFRGSETGATLAKYIDIPLWKDDDHVIHNDINVNMMNRRGATALYEAAVQALSDPVRSLLEAGANPNARLNNDPREPSVLQATFWARDATSPDDHVRHHMFKEVISHLEYAGAVLDPTSLEERGGYRERGRST